MLQAAGRASSTCLRRVSRGILQSLNIPHHGIVFQRAQSNTRSPEEQQRRLDDFSSPRRRRRRLGRVVGRTLPELLAADTVESAEDDVIQWSELETSGEAYQLKDNDEKLREDSISSQPSRPGKLSKEKVSMLEEQDRPEEQVTGLREIGEIFPRPNEPHFYVDGEAPPDDQLKAAGRFFKQHKPKFAFSCAKFLEFPDSSIPEFCFIGRSNVGKSSLLNALFYASSSKPQDKEDLAVTSPRAGRTKTLNVFLAGNIDGGTKNVLRNGKMKPERWISTGRGIAIVDMPGYGFGSDTSQGEEILKYLSKRKQLRRTFVLLSSEHGLTNRDEEIFRILEQAGISYQIVMTKVDKRLNVKPNVAPSKPALKGWTERLRQTRQELVESANPPIRDVLCVSATKSFHVVGKHRNELFGMNGLRLAMLQAAGLDRAEIPVLPTKRADPPESETRQRREKEVEKERHQDRFLRREMHREEMEQKRGGGWRENVAREELSGRKRTEDHDRRHKWTAAKGQQGQHRTDEERLPSRRRTSKGAELQKRSSWQP